MLFRAAVVDNPYNELVEKIKKEIISTLRKKGVNISQVHIDLNSNNVNVSVSITEN